MPQPTSPPPGECPTQGAGQSPPHHSGNEAHSPGCAAPSPSTGPFASATALQSALHAGELSAVEAAQHYLQRIAENPQLGAFVTVTAEQALTEASEADAALAAWQANRALPPLLGLPIAHKDIVDVAGTPTTSGSAAVPAGPATTDHPVVAQLRAAGTVSLGKTQVPEFGLTSYSENRVAPPARNPYDLDLTPGGSSGGSAAAVAAGLLPVAPGSDGGGSIRIPALACGLVGLKPGLGAVPGDVARGLHDSFGAPVLTVSGPLARSAADAALLMDALADPAASGSHRAAVDRAGALSDLTVAVSTASPFDAALDVTLAPAALSALELAADRLAEHGHRVGGADFRYDPGYFDFFTEGWIAGLSLLELDAGRAEQLMPLTREMRARALARSRDQHRANAARMHAFARSAREQWGRTDIVLTPGLAMAPPRIGEFTALSPADDYALQCRWTPFTSMVNVSGLPAIAVPISRDAAGLPVGVQLIGRAGSEPQLLALAAQLTA
ncbi:amidase [Leucobacter albus]|uniref:Amidase n=1 Tax=Leucobacter albus TaxID=272210 RepID=A0ABW3TVA2_9MICO